MNQRPRILVIDDEAFFRSSLSASLRKHFLISVATGGLDGFQKAQAHPPDVALVDLVMPGWDGLRTLKSFRNHANLAEVPVMMLTCDASRRSVQACIEAGANDYVLKQGLSFEKLAAKLQGILRDRGMGPLDWGGK